jgi:acyl carrier protein
MPFKSEIKKFMIDNFLYGQNDSDFNDDDSFLEKGLIDSTGVLELVSFIEETYGFSLKDEELIPDNLDSVNRIAAFVERKRRNGNGDV